MDNPERLQAPGMNRMIREARGDVIVRMDVHSDYAGDYVRRCIEVLDRTGADNVGGAARPRANTFFQRALCAALESPLGVGGSKYRDESFEGFVETIFPGAFRRRVFEKIGLYDPCAVTNEDAELNQRLIDSGGKIYLSRDIVVHYYPRESFRALSKQYFKYGHGARMPSLLAALPVRPAVPFLLVCGGAALLATSAIQPMTPSPSAATRSHRSSAVRVGRRKAGALAIPVVW